MNHQSLLAFRSAGTFLPLAATLCVLVCLVSASLWAGGPFASGIIPGEGFTRWDPAQPVGYLVDPGVLSNSQNNAVGTQLVDEAFARWSDIPSASLTAQNMGQLPADVNAANFQQFILAANQPISIIFDHDGAIIDSIFGAGASNTTLGFASPTNADILNHYTSGFIVLGGRFATSAGFSQTVTHELGHVLGLDHTQANERFQGTAFHDFVPLMYPFALPGQGPEPELDDRAWFSFIYPAPGFSDQFGQIEGRALRANGLPMHIAHVSAVLLEDSPEGPLLSDSQVVASAANYLAVGDGKFILPGLPEGQYAVFVEPIRPEFTTGSSVGPFDFNTNRPTDYPLDFFNGDGESGSEDPLEAVPVAVELGQIIRGVNILVNNVPSENPQIIDLGDDDFAFVDFPEGFAFPFLGQLYGQMLVHSDGSLTFMEEDISTNSRSAARLVLGPIRIAPLFTDLNPDDGGTIQMVSSPAEVRVEWNGVPEFTDGLPATPPGPGNTFAAILRSNGDIVFEYQQIALTAEDGQLVAVAGISPGVLAQQFPATETDLSQGVGGALPFDGSGTVFEEFLVGDTFDLQGAQVVFRPQAETFIFPFLEADDTRFTGFAAANVSPGDSAVTLENFLSDGTSADLPVNPSVRPLFQDAQFAQVGNEIFDLPVQTEQGGWVRMTSNRSELASFFQFGNGLSGTPTSQLDGGVAIRGGDVGDVLFFSRVLQGPVFLTPGAQVETETVFSIINPSDEEIEIEARYFRTTGVNDFNPATRVIPPRGAIRESFPELFGNTPPLMDGYVRVDLVRGSQVAGFQLIRLPDSVFGLNAFRPGEVNTIYSAQLANGGAGGVFSFTNLNLVNTSNQLLEVTITAVDENGQIINVPQIVAINPNASLQRDASEFFGLGLPSSSTVRTGSIIAQADQPGLVGDVIFGDPVAFNTAAAMQLQSQTFREAFFSQVANNESIFTGLAIFNPDTADTAQVTIQVFDMTGTLVGETLLTLGPEARVSQVLAVLVPEAANQVGGYIRLQSDIPIVAQELFGNNGVTFLSAVPPQAETP